MHIFEHIDKRAAIGFLVIFVLIVGFFFYWLSTTSVEDEGPLSVIPISPLDASLGRELLSALAKLESTKLDTTIFDDPVFASLTDFGVEIASQPVGRRNPFASFDVPTGATKPSGGGVKAPVLSGGGAKTPPKTTPPKATPPEETGGFDVE